MWGNFFMTIFFLKMIGLLPFLYTFSKLTFFLAWLPSAYIPTFLPTAYVVRDGRLYFHFVCQSTPAGGGGVTPERSRWGGGVAQSGLTGGTPAGGGGYASLGDPPDPGYPPPPQPGRSGWRGGSPANGDPPGVPLRDRTAHGVLD